MISTKKYLRNEKGEVVEAGPRTSGALVVNVGGEIDDKTAKELGIFPGTAPKKSESVASPKKPWLDAAGNEHKEPPVLSLEDSKDNFQGIPETLLGNLSKT